MAKVLLEMSLSLDGYVTGPDVSPEEPSLRPIEVKSTPRATHLTYEVDHSAADAR